MTKHIKIIKPKIDKGEYEYVVLNNKMEVVIIYDKDTDISAAALTVAVGYNNDPKDFQGLAHFLEHMLFMGTKKYPDENYYHKTIIESGGLSNAHTMEDNTTYYFQTFNEHFEKCIDLFAQFFVEPLFKKDSVQREINAVNSEYEKNITHEFVRLQHIAKEFVDPNHPYSNFGCGNKTTLDKPNIREVLIEFYNKYYSANKMKLVIMTNKKIKNHIVDIFSKVKNYDLKHNIITSLPFTDSGNNGLCRNLIKLVPIEDHNYLNIIWQMPIQDQYCKPLDYISYLLGHESEGSVYYFLKKENLCISLMTNIMGEDLGFHLYGITLELTEKGHKYIPSIIDCIYKYIDMINKQDKIIDFYDELKIINQINFDYQIIGEKIDYVSELSMRMLKFKPSEIISGIFMLSQNKKETIEQELKKTLDYIKKDNAIITISSRIYDKITTKTEKYFGGKYINYINPKTFGKEFNNKVLQYTPHLPEKNIFLPNEKNLKMIEPTNLVKNNYPVKLESKNFEIWYKYDNVFKIPKVFCNIVLYNDEFYKNTEHVTLLSLYLSIIHERINPKLYYANMCGETGYSFGISSNYINIMFYGFIEGVEKIINLYIDTFFNIQITKQEFNLAIYEMKKNHENFKFLPPYITADEYFKEKFYINNHTNEEILKQLESIKFTDIQKPKKYFTQTCGIKLFVYGNINKDIVDKLQNKFKVFCTEKLNNLDNKAMKAIVLQDGEQHTYIKKSVNIEETNNLICLFFEVGSIIKNKSQDWDKNILCIQLLELLLHEKFFSELRTKEQNGYIVRSFVKNYSDEKGHVMGIAFMIQSPIKYPNELRNRIKKFITDTYNELKNITEKEIDLFKKTLKSTIHRKFESQIEEFNFMMEEIASGEYVFNYKELLSKSIDKVNKQSLLKFYEKYLLDKNTRKIRILEMYKGNKIIKN